MLTLDPLRLYQIDALSRLRDAARRWRARKPGYGLLAVAPTGAGKTRLALELATAAVSRGRRVLWLAPRTELIDQPVDRLRECGWSDVQVVQADRARGEGPIIVASIQTLVARGELPEADLVVMDECLPADSLVRTPCGMRAISTLAAGDYVVGYIDGDVAACMVVDVMVREPSAMVVVHHERGRLCCTPNHPLYTRRGYVEARLLSPVDEVMTNGEPCSNHVSRVRCSYPGEDGIREKESEGPRGLLLGGVPPFSALAPQSGGACRGTRTIRRSDAAGSPVDEHSWRAREDGRDASPHRSSSEVSRRQRLRPDEATGCVASCFGGRMGSGARGPNGQSASAGGANALQDRLGEPDVAGGGGGRRGEPHGSGAEGAGPEKGQLLAWSRVVSVEAVQPGSDGRYGGLCPDGRVYNLEVEATHNYFADGVLVHNCRHYVASEWGQVARHYLSSVRVGLDATPARADGAPLGELFDEIVEVATVQQLTADGWLVPARIVAPASYAKELADDPVTWWRTWAAGRRGLVFCSSRRHAAETAKAFQAAGLRALAVDSHSPPDQRALAVASLRSGDLDVLVNVQLFTEGFDAPGVDCIVVARGVAHEGTWLQILGRGLRPADGKADCLVGDLRGHCHRHGYPEDPRTWHLDGRPIRRQEQLPVAVQCRQCHAWGRGPVCASCGAQKPPPPLPRLSKREMAERRRERAPRGGREWLRFVELWGQALACDWKPQAVSMRFRSEFGHWPTWGRRQAEEALGVAREAAAE